MGVKQSINLVGAFFMVYLIGMLAGHYITGTAFFYFIGVGAAILLIGGVFVDTYFHK